MILPTNILAPGQIRQNLQQAPATGNIHHAAVPADMYGTTEFVKDSVFLKQMKADVLWEQNPVQMAVAEPGIAVFILKM